jgi:hypothetical protein
MEDLISDFIPVALMAMVLTAMSYAVAWMLRSRYTPIKIDGNKIAKAPLFTGIGLLALTLFCIMPTSCFQAENERTEAVEEYKERLESKRHRGQWYYGKLYPHRSRTLDGGIFEAPASIEATGETFRFVVHWKENNRIERRSPYSGELAHHDSHTVYQGTWYTANTKQEGEWTLFEVSDDYYCGWVKDKGDKDAELFYLRRER